MKKDYQLKKVPWYIFISLVSWHDSGCTGHQEWILAGKANDLEEGQKKWTDTGTVHLQSSGIIGVFIIWLYKVEILWQKFNSSFVSTPAGWIL